jgi:hypothetical protein
MYGNNKNVEIAFFIGLISKVKIKEINAMKSAVGFFFFDYFWRNEETIPFSYKYTPATFIDSIELSFQNGRSNSLQR